MLVRALQRGDVEPGGFAARPNGASHVLWAPDVVTDYLVALTRWARPPSADLLAAEVAVLSPALGVGAYELRLALSAPLPVVLLQTDDADRARALLASLRARGHGAVACDAAQVGSSAHMLQPKSFALGPEELVFEAPGRGATKLGHAEVLALILATHVIDQDSTEERREKKLSLGRAALTGGLVRSKTTRVTERSATRETERVLYVLHRAGAGHVVLRETRLHYTGLGARMGKSTLESFTTLVGLLRAALPRASYDDRLLKPRAGNSLSLSRSASTSTVTTSNERELDLAVHLLAVAMVQAQL